MSAPLANATLLQAFTSLAEVDASKRQQAVSQLAAVLRDAQKSFEDQSQKLGTLPALQSARPCCNELSYAVGRLCRGVTSSNAAARQGYTVALAETLSTFPNVKTVDVLEQLRKATAGGSQASKSEIRDALLGKVAGNVALIRSGRLNESDAHSAAPAAKPGAPSAPVAQVLVDLLAAGSKKPWLADAASEGIAALFASVPSAAWKVLQAVVEQAVPPAVPATEWTPLQLHVALAVEAAWLHWYQTEDAKLSSPPACVTKLRQALAALGSESGHCKDTDGNAAVPLASAALASARALPSLHGLWGLLLRRYAPAVGDSFFADSGASSLAGAAKGSTDGTAGKGTEGSSKKDKAGKGSQAAAAPAPATAPTLSGPSPSALFSKVHSSAEVCLAEFTSVWRALVEGTLLKAGPERRGLGLVLLENVLLRLKQSPQAQAHASVLLDVWLGPSALKTLVHHGGGKKDPLNKPCHAVLRALSHVCDGKPALAGAALVCLATRGHPAFDRLTHTTTLASLLAQLDHQALVAHIRSLVARFVRPPSSNGGAATASEDAEGASEKKKGGAAGKDQGKGGKKGKGKGKDEDSDDEDDGVDVSDAALTRALGGAAAADDEDDEDEDGDGKSKMPEADVERLQLAEALLSALKQASLASLRDAGLAAPIFSLLSFHAFSSVEVAAGTAEAKAVSALAGQATVSGLGLQQLADGASPAALLIAQPALSDECKTALRARLTAAVRDVSAAHVPAGPAPGGKGAASAAAAAQRADRTLLMSRALQTLSQAICNASAAGQALSSAGLAGVTVAASNGLASTADDDEDEDEDMDEDDEDDEEGSEHSHDHGSQASRGPAMRPAAVCARALAASTAVSDILRCLPASATAAGADSDGKVKAKVARRAEAVRAVSSFAGLVTSIPASMYLGADADEDNTTTGHGAPGSDAGRARRLADALNDLLITSRTLLKAPLRTLEKAVAETTAAVSGAGGTAASASPAGVTGKKDKKDRKSGVATSPAAAAFTSARAAFATAVAEAVSAVGADEDDDEHDHHGHDHDDHDHEEDQGLRGADKDAAVFFDALLAVLAEPSATLREAVKLAARACAGSGAVRHPDVLGSVLGVLAHGVSGGAPGADDDADGNSDSEAGDDDDEESITLDAGDDALGMLLGKAGDVSGASKAKAKASGAAPGAKRPRPNEDEDGSDDDEDASDDDDDEEDEAADPAALRADMEKHDRMLEGILRLQKAKTGAAKAGARRDAHFRFRAFDLLEAAVTRLAAGSGAADEGEADGAPAARYAAPVLVQLLPGLLDVVRKLVARVKAKRAAGNENAANDSQKLVDKVTALLSRAAKAKVPSVVASETASSDAAAAAATAEYTAADITQAWAIATLESSMAVARSAPLPSALDAAGAVASACVRLLRDPAQVAAHAEATAAGTDTAGGSPQVALSAVPAVAAAYRSALVSLLTERHPHVTAAFLRNALSGAPVLAVELLSTLSSLLSARPCAIPKAFRVSEAITLGGVLARSALSAWAKDIPGAVKTTKKAKAGKDGSQGSSGAASSVSTVVTVGSAAPKAIAAFQQAIASVLADSAARPNRGAAGGAEGSGAEASSTALHPKMVREVLADGLRPLQKAGVILSSAASGTSGEAAAEDGSDALLTALEGLASSTPNEHVRRAAGAILTAAGRAVPEFSGTAGQAGADEDEDMDGQEGASSSASGGAGQAGKDKGKNKGKDKGKGQQKGGNDGGVPQQGKPKGQGQGQHQAKKPKTA